MPIARASDDDRDYYAELGAWILRSRQYGFRATHVALSRWFFDKVAADPRVFHLSGMGEPQFIINYNGRDVRFSPEHEDRIR